jgi:hypothetical protein
MLPPVSAPAGHEWPDWSAQDYATGKPAGGALCVTTTDYVPGWVTRCARWRVSRTGAENDVRRVIPPCRAWHRLTRMQQMVAQQPALALAVSCMTLYDQLDLTLELLHVGGNTYLDEDPAESWPSNVIRFRTRRAR